MKRLLGDRVSDGAARALLGFLYVPIVAVVVLSFNGADVTYAWGGLSLRWYGELFADERLLTTLRTSLLVGVVTATLATAVGVSTAVGLGGRRVRGGRLLLGGLALPLFVPEIVLAVALLTVFGDLDARLGTTTLVLGHLVVTIPYAALVLIGAHSQLDASLPEAAADLGCGPWQVFWRVTLPLLRPAMMASWLLAFTTSFGNIVMSTFTSGVGTTTLPLQVYSQLKGGLTPEINALGTLLVLATLLILLAVGARQLRSVLAATPRP